MGEADLHIAAKLLERVDSMLATYERRSSAFVVPGTFSLLRDVRAALAAATEPPEAAACPQCDNDVSTWFTQRRGRRYCGACSLPLAAGSAPIPQGPPRQIARLYDPSNTDRVTVLGAPDEPTDDDLTELRRLHEAATPGPWEASVMGSEGYAVMGGPRPGQRFRDRVARCGDVDWDTDKANAELVAAMRNALPGLLAEVERLSGSEAALRRAFEIAKEAGVHLWAEVERLRAAAPASEDEWEVFTASDGEPALRMKAAGSPPPTPAPTREQIHDAIADALSEHVWAHGTGEIDGDGIAVAADAVMGLIAQPDREPLWRGKTEFAAEDMPDASLLPALIVDLPPGTAVRVDKDTP